MNMRVLHLFIVLMYMVVSTALGEDKELRLLGLQPMTGEAWPGGWSCVVPVQMAIEAINNRTDILDGYKLTYDYIDHEVFVFITCPFLCFTNKKILATMTTPFLIHV